MITMQDIKDEMELLGIHHGHFTVSEGKEIIEMINEGQTIKEIVNTISQWDILRNMTMN